jgi:hypothetical protein
MTAHAHSSSEGEDLLSYLPPAQEQTRLAPEATLHSANCGVIIRRTGQIKNEFRNQAREFALEFSEHINQKQVGVISTFLYEETFGTQDRIHWVIHLRSLGDYMRFHQMGHTDRVFGEIFMRNRAPHQEGGADWSKMFLQGTFQETVLFPHYWGCEGSTTSRRPPPRDRRQAQHQTTVPPDKLLHSVNARMLVLRSGQLKHEFRAEGREFAREYAEHLNQRLVDHATSFVYEEHLGTQDRIHWWTHLNTLEDYELLAQLGADDDGLRELLLKERIPAARGGGNWSRMFVDSSIQEVVICPQHPLKDF